VKFLVDPAPSRRDPLSTPGFVACVLGADVKRVASGSGSALNLRMTTASWRGQLEAGCHQWPTVSTLAALERLPQPLLRRPLSTVPAPL